MTNLRTRDIIALGFMTFALFIGAGNITFPPIVAQQAGEHVWLAALGFSHYRSWLTRDYHYGVVTCRRFYTNFKFAFRQNREA